MRRYGADAAFPIGELDERLPRAARGPRARCTTARPATPSSTRSCCGCDRAAAQAQQRRRAGRRAQSSIRAPCCTSCGCSSRAEELARMRRAAAITAEAHRRRDGAPARPGVGEYELEALIDYTFRRRGGGGPGYATIVGAGANATILHYVDNNATRSRRRRPACWSTPAASTTTTPPTSRAPSRRAAASRAEQRALYELVLARADARRSRRSQPGASPSTPSTSTACARLTEGMIELGLLAGRGRRRIETAPTSRFYMHRTRTGSASTCTTSAPTTGATAARGRSSRAW